ncbi:pyridoxamine 5'-phosphate oxidase family protein [Pollutibacter soli]|uniref:pyridoxamine 5'-phosphate oxidase family protein n=1 Tax=Pollutibacter soli TaxID=3034157 RepID=UPI0030132E6E
MINDEVKEYIESSVLCWLATCDSKGIPNVSPKEMFTYLDENKLIIAHIASPNTVRNIRENPKVCVSFVDVFVQKGFKLMGVARLVKKNNDEFIAMLKKLTDIYSEKFPVKAIIEITVNKADRIVAPSYFLFPDTTSEENQIEAAYKTYGIKAI